MNVGKFEDQFEAYLNPPYLHSLWYEIEVTKTLHRVWISFVNCSYGGEPMITSDVKALAIVP